MAQKLDLIAIGRAGVDLYGQQTGGRLEDMGGFAKYVGGSPTNTAIGASRLGLKTGLITRVGGDHMGRFIREELVREGVDVSGVKTDAERLTALVILGIRDRETFPLIFYRENCADMALNVDDLDEAHLASAGAVLLSGTHLSKPNVFEMSVRAAEIVKRAGGKVAFDVDYRPVLWGLTALEAGENRFVADNAVTQKLQRVLKLCDLIVGTEEEIHILGGATDTIAALKAIRAQTKALLVCKRGPLGCSAFPGEIPDSLDKGVVGRGFPVEVFNVLGAGDAFMSGFLRGWLKGLPLEKSCELANAAGAIVVSRHSCAPAMPTWEEMNAFLAKPLASPRLREDAELEHLHWATTRHGTYDEIAILAMDHRSQFEDLAQELGANEDKIPAFKTLALRAVDKLARGDARFGVLLDGRYGMRALERAADFPYWIGRPIELPKSRPLEFESSADVATELNEWPLNHVVKCLLFYHPDDDAEMKARQERQILRLFDACRKTRHEFLLEVIASKDGPVDSETVSRVMQRFYDLGVKPDWWKLEPAADAKTWANVERTIRANDPHCRGVVLLGLSAPQEELLASFKVAAGASIVKGFAVGRTIFNGVAAKWFAGKIDDEQAVDALSENFRVLVDAWRAAENEGAMRLTGAQAAVRYLSAQCVEMDGREVPYFAGAWAIFGHGNVAGLGEALYAARDVLPTYRAHNEQAMAHAGIAYAKQMRRQRAMICTTSIGPGATNMVTAAALAHVNRLPVLFLPGDVYASRRPDPVLQQIEDFGDGTISANDCFKPVSRYFDRIMRPEQLLDALPKAMAVLTDPANCGPVTLGFCQDVQAEAFDFPDSFFAKRVWRTRKQPADPREIGELADLIKAAKAPLIVAGGGVLYARAEDKLRAFAEATQIPVTETQAGKGALVWDHPQALGSIGVTGTSAANAAAEAADLVIAVGTRLQDFTTGSRALFKNPKRKLVQVNVSAFDAHKHDALPVVGDAGAVLEALTQAVSGYRAPTAWSGAHAKAVSEWNSVWDTATRASSNELPSDAQVIGAVWRNVSDNAVVVCAAGGLPGELHKLWRVKKPGGYHLEYGYSCMGYEIAGGLGVKMAQPERDVVVMVGDGSYLMMNSEIATSVMLGLRLTIVVLDNRGFGCINRLQRSTGSESFNNLLADAKHETLPDVDFAAHAASLGAKAVKVSGLAELEAALARAKSDDRTSVIVIDTDPMITTEAGGHWWDVAVPEVSERADVKAARKAYEDKLKARE